MDLSSHPVHQEVLQAVVPKAAENVKGISGDAHGTPSSSKEGWAEKYSDEFTKQPKKDKDSPLHSLFTSSLNASLQLCFLPLHGKELSDCTSRFQLSSIWSREQAPPSSQHWLTDGRRQKLVFPVMAMAHRSSLQQSWRLQAASSRKRNLRKPVCEKKVPKFEGKWSIAKSCGYVSQVSWYFDLIFFFYFFLALASKSKKHYEHLSMRTVEKSWKIERRDC